MKDLSETANVNPMRKAEQVREGLYRSLPSVNEVLLLPELQKPIDAHGHERVANAVRDILITIRSGIRAEEISKTDLELEIKSIPTKATEMLRNGPRYSLRRVINATGVILHTNLGRAPLSKAALEHVLDVARDYCNLEFDLQNGERSKRDIHVERLLLRVLGVMEDEYSRWGAVVVNNCAAATFLALNTLAEKHEVVVSRGELVEIGGGFRIPEILEKSGALLREIGTTNRTRAEDYEKAITDGTALLLRVHQSNFSIEGFVERPALRDLVSLAKTVGIPLFEDQGTGLISRLSNDELANQPALQDSLHAGVDLVAASGDKLLGGPQCGLLVGRADLIARIRKNPLLRAFRVDKLTYAALEATLFEYLGGQVDSVPLMRMLSTPAEDIEKRCHAIVDSIKSAEMSAAVIPVESVIGGGTAPSARIRSYAVSIQKKESSADELLRKLRESEPPVIGRIAEDAIVLDLRTVDLQMDVSIARILEQL